MKQKRRSALARVQLKKFREAIQDFTSLIGLEPTNPMAFLNRGVCYLEISENNEACKDFKKAKDLGFKDEKLNQFIESCK